MVAEVRRDDAAAPVEVDVGDVHASASLVLVHAEDPFVEHAGETFELRPDAPYPRSKLLHEADGLCASYGEEYDFLNAASAPAETVHDLLHAHPQGVSAGDDVAYHQRAVLLDVELLVTDVQAGDDAILDDAFAGDEIHVAHRDAFGVAALFERVVEPSAEYGQNTDFAVQTSVDEVVKGGECGGNHATVGVETDDFRRSHELARAGTADYVITVGETLGLESVNTCVIAQVRRQQACILQDGVWHGYPD